MCLPSHHSTLYLPSCLFTQLLKPPLTQKWRVFLFFVLPFQLALGQGARRMHVSAAFSAKAKVSMSRFETTSYVNYEKLQSNIDIVRKRSRPRLQNMLAWHKFCIMPSGSYNFLMYITLIAHIKVCLGWHPKWKKSSEHTLGIWA